MAKFDKFLGKIVERVVGGVIDPGVVPDASTSTKGIIQLATGAEVTAGTNTAKAVVPSTLKTELDKKVAVVAGKGLSTNDYDNTDAAKVATINNAALTTLAGTAVSVAPWGRYYWSADGTCTLTASGFGASGLEYAALLLDVAEAATLAVSGATVAEDDAITAAGQYMVYLINQGGTVHFRVASFTEAA